jgi:hypothetical protein
MMRTGPPWMCWYSFCSGAYFSRLHRQDSVGGTEWRRRPFTSKVAQNLARLLSPLL